MLGLWRIICQCKTSNGPIYCLLQAVEFQQSLINLFRSVSLEIQRGVLHGKENISSLLKDKEMDFFVVTLFGCKMNEFFIAPEAREGWGNSCSCVSYLLFCVHD